MGKKRGRECTSNSNGREIRIAFKVHRTTELADRKLTLSGLNRTHLGCAKMVPVFFILRSTQPADSPKLRGFVR